MLNKIALIGFIALGLLVAAAGATWAAISDTESSTANNIVSGTLDLKPLITGSYSGLISLYHVTPGGDGINGNVIFDKIAPGQSGTIEWVLENTGTAAGTLTLSSTAIFTDGVTAVEPESLFGAGNNGGGNGDLDQYLLVSLQKGQGTDAITARAAFTYLMGPTPVSISGLEAVLDSQQNIPLAAAGGSDTLVYWITWSLNDTEPNINIVQGDTARIDMTFYLNQ
jgi:hypothetical protein